MPVVFKEGASQPRREAEMGFILQLPEALGDELRQQAADEQISVEELAQRLMRNALREHIDSRRWHSQNRRRLELIANKMKRSLSTEEEEEFQQLRALACE